jgi:hypothetical protein
MSDLNSIRDRLINEWRILVIQWRTTCNEWRDSQRIRFEKEFWTKFERSIPKFLDELAEMNKLIEKITRELESLN